MKDKLELNDVAAITGTCYGHQDVLAWNYERPGPMPNAGDGLLTFLLNEMTCAADMKPIDALSEMLRLTEVVHRDVRLFQARLATYIVDALNAAFVDWFIASQYPFSDIRSQLLIWRKAHLRYKIEATFGTALEPVLEKALAEVKDQPENEQAQLVLAKFRGRIMLSGESLPEGAPLDPLYASNLKKPATPDGRGSLPPEGQPAAV